MSNAQSHFATTHWSCVFRARGESDEARAALNDLCTAYYAPVQTFLKFCVRQNESAEDLTQDFFTRVLTGRAFDHVDPKRGRFRSFLLGAVKHFLLDRREYELALKRGGGVLHLSLEVPSDISPGFDVADPNAISPESAFERQWAMTVLDRALYQLQNEMTLAGKGTQFEALKQWLIGNAEESQSMIAARLGMNENAVKVAIHRLRRRFRDLVVAEIANTVLDPEEQEDELKDLITALGQ